MKREKSGETRVLLFTLFGFFALLFCFCFHYLSKKGIFQSKFSNFHKFFVNIVLFSLFCVVTKQARSRTAEQIFFVVFFSGHHKINNVLFFLSLSSM